MTETMSCIVADFRPTFQGGHFRNTLLNYCSLNIMAEVRLSVTVTVTRTFLMRRLQ